MRASRASRSVLSRFESLEQQRGIRAAEAERVGERILNRQLAVRVRHVIEVAAVVRHLRGDGRRGDLMATREDGDAGFEAAGGAEQVARHRFGRGHGELVGVPAEAPPDGERLDLVAVRRRRAVRVDVIDPGRRDAGALERLVHDAERAVAVVGRRRDVVRVGRHAVADQLGVDARVAAGRKIELLEDEHAGAFADDEPVAILVEGAARALGLVVARGERAQRAEAADPHRRNRGFRSAGDHHVGVTAPDDLEGVADGVRRGGARGARGGVGALRAVADGDLPGGEVDDRRRDEKRRDLARPTLEQRLVLAFDGGEPADAGRDEHAGARAELGRDHEPRIVHRKLRRRDRVLDEDVHLLDVFPVDELQRVEVLHLARDAGRELRRVELGDPRDAALARAERGPIRLGSDAERRHQADARDDDSPCVGHGSYFLVLACDSMYSTASFTRVIFSASSSGISIPNSSSNAITSSTVSSESAPRSSTNDASGVTSSSSTPSCSTMMLFTFSATAIQPSYVYIPPLTARTCPVIYDASSDARKHTAAATSSTVPSRPSGIWAAQSTCVFPLIARVMSVSTSPGATTFTVMARDATSRASALAKPIRPAFDAA